MRVGWVEGKGSCFTFHRRYRHTHTHRHITHTSLSLSHTHLYATTYGGSSPRGWPPASPGPRSPCCLHTCIKDACASMGRTKVWSGGTDVYVCMCNGDGAKAWGGGGQGGWQPTDCLLACLLAPFPPDVTHTHKETKRQRTRVRRALHPRRRQRPVGHLYTYVCVRAHVYICVCACMSVSLSVRLSRTCPFRANAGTSWRSNTPQ